MSIAVTDRTAPGAADTQTLPGETGMVERPRARWLPFSPWHLLLMPTAIVMLIPLVWMIVTSLETIGQTRHFPPILWPGQFQWSNYAETLRAAPFARWFWNTTVVTTVVVLSNLLLCSLAAYAFARIRFLGKQVTYFLLLATLMVPLQVVLIPTFLIVKRMGLIDHLGALIVPNLANVFGIFMLTQFFRTLPIELEEAARIDGASRLKILFTIVLPLSTAGARDPRGDPVPVDVERLPVAARHDHQQHERLHAPARAAELPGCARDRLEPADGRQRDGDAPDARSCSWPPSGGSSAASRRRG